MEIIDDNDTKNLVLKIFDKALGLLKQQGYRNDIINLKVRLDAEIYRTMTLKDFFREYVWVIFTSGFKARYVKKHWDEIREMTFDFDPHRTKKKTFEELREQSPNKNTNKLNALLRGSAIVTEKWWKKIQSDPIQEKVMFELRKLPFIGKVTIFHIMRNIGFDFFKPDTHIENLAEILGIEDKEMFKIIHQNRDFKYFGVIDYILWQACELFVGAQNFFKWSTAPEGQSDVPKNVVNKVRGAEETLF